MSVYGNSNTPVVVAILSVAVLGMTVWCGNALWGQMKTEGILKQMRSIQLSIRQYAVDNKSYCPDDLGVLVDKAYCPDGKLYRVPGSSGIPNSGADIRAGLCDFVYLGKGMKMDTSAKMKTSKGGDSEDRAFPLLHLKEPFRGEWLVVYSDGHPEAYEGKPGFIKDAAPARKPVGAQ